MSANHNPQPDNNTRLEALFGALRERESLLTDDEIRNIVRTEAARTSAPQKASRSVRFPQRFFTKKTMLISSVVAAVFASAALFTTLVWKPSAANTNPQLKQPDFQVTQKPIASSSIRLEGIRNPKREIVRTKSDKESIAVTSPVSKIPLNTAGIHFLELTSTEALRFGLLVSDTLIKSVRIQEDRKSVV